MAQMAQLLGAMGGGGGGAKAVPPGMVQVGVLGVWRHESVSDMSHDHLCDFC